MCGIFIHRNPDVVDIALQEMHYRGPDRQQFTTANGLTVGFARLAIVATKEPEAEQPYMTRKGRILVMNGELYNYRSLNPAAKSEVALLGELLDDGGDPRQLIDGDYAIAYYDPSNARLTLYRDRFGMCPLYYRLRPDIAVSSERRKLWSRKRVPKEVRPYERVIIDTQECRVVSRHLMPHYGSTVVDTFASQRMFETLLSQAVFSRARHTDSNYSVTCSGGLDSSAVLVALKHATLTLPVQEPARLLCVSWGETEDLKHAEKVASHLGWADKLHPILIREEDIDEAASSIWHHIDLPPRCVQPLNWRVAVRNWFVAQHSNTRVVLTGEGADEMFDGYPPADELWPPHKRIRKQLSQLRSLPKCSLEFSNKIGLAHSREFRAPFLHSLLSYFILATDTGRRKKLLRDYLKAAGLRELAERDKWGINEKRIDSYMKAA